MAAPRPDKKLAQVLDVYNELVEMGFPDDVASNLVVAERINSVSFTLNHFANKVDDLVKAVRR